MLCSMCLVTQSCPALRDPIDSRPPSSSVRGNSLGKNTGGVAMPSSRGSSQPRDPTQVSCTAACLFTIGAVREALPRILVVNNLPSDARDVGLIPDGGLG